MKRIKRNILYLLVLIAITFGLTTKVDAICTSTRYNNLKKLAYKATVSYELKFDENHDHYFLLTVNNIDKDVYVRFEGRDYEANNGTLSIPYGVYGGETYEIMLYAGLDTDCKEEYLYTKKITLPRYNPYSEREECIEYEEFYLCDKWYPGYVTSEQTFLNELHSYIISLNGSKQDTSPKSGRNIFQIIIDFYKDNLIFTLPITIIILMFILYKIIVKIIRRRNRIKLNSK